MSLKFDRFRRTTRKKNSTCHNKKICVETTSGSPRNLRIARVRVSEALIDPLSVTALLLISTEPVLLKEGVSLETQLGVLQHI